MEDETRTWGPPMWGLIHSLAAAARDEHAAAMHATIVSIAMNVPCAICSGHAAAYFKRNSAVPRSATQLFDMTVDFHNSVNGRRGKRLWSAPEAAELYPVGQWRRYATVIPTVVRTVRTTLHDRDVVARLRRLAALQTALAGQIHMLQG